MQLAFSKQNRTNIFETKLVTLEVIIEVSISAIPTRALQNLHTPTMSFSETTTPF